MYQVSRGIYRELSAEIVTGREGHAAVLKASEQAIERLATDRHYFAAPARSLFREIRVHFPIQSQPRVGSACRRLPSNANGYCPSHQHLAVTEEIEIASAA